MSRRTLLSGMIFGSILLAALTLVGIIIAAPSPRPPVLPQAADTGTRTATQPELEAALLGRNDLPPDFQPDPTPKQRRSRTAEKCAVLLDPAALVRSTDPESTASSRHTGPERQQINQVLAGFTGDQARRAFYQLREVGRGCRDFTAKLADGTAVKVRVENLVASQTSPALLELGGQAHTIRLTIRSAQRTLTGYLALGRVGKLLTVLSQVGPVSQQDMNFNELLNTVTQRLLLTSTAIVRN